MIGGELQTAIYEKLIAANICDGRIYDRVEGDKPFPYVQIGDEQVVDIGNDCAKAWESTATIHVWSRPVAGSKIELKQLLAQLQPLLCTPALNVAGFNISIAQLETVRAFTDSDGQTQHGVLSVSYSLHPNS
ncbi:DUF3168 domain-containing protein [Maritalea sp.]|uniref:DUF3168 domain-containing protein n=1 Tax=Maritalea sp. TaxID=2003361 RepID=UPI003EF7234B